MIQIIPKAGNQEKVKEAEQLYETLTSKGIGAILDDRQQTTIGNSIKDAQILGTPYIAVLGDKVKKDEIEIECTKTGKKIIIPKHEILSVVNKEDVKEKIKKECSREK